MTGNMPGIAASTRLTLALGAAPKEVEAPENSFASDVTCAWTSSPMMTSQSPVAPGMKRLASGVRVSIMDMAACGVDWDWLSLVQTARSGKGWRLRGSRRALIPSRYDPLHLGDDLLAVGFDDLEVERHAGREDQHRQPIAVLIA